MFTLEFKEYYPGGHKYLNLVYRDENSSTTFQPDEPENILKMDFENTKSLEFCEYDGEFSLYWGPENIYWLHSLHGGQRGALGHVVKTTPENLASLLECLTKWKAHYQQ